MTYLKSLLFTTNNTAIDVHWPSIHLLYIYFVNIFWHQLCFVSQFPSIFSPTVTHHTVLVTHRHKYMTQILHHSFHPHNSHLSLPILTNNNTVIEQWFLDIGSPYVSILCVYCYLSCLSSTLIINRFSVYIWCIYLFNWVQYRSNCAHASTKEREDSPFICLSFTDYVKVIKNDKMYTCVGLHRSTLYTQKQKKTRERETDSPFIWLRNKKLH